MEIDARLPGWCRWASSIITAVSRCGHEVPRFSLRVIRAYANFDGATERGEPSRKPVYRHAFHTAAKNLGERGLVGAAAARGFQLRELAPLDGFVNRLNESAF